MINKQISKPSDLGQVVREARKAQALTQEALSGITGTGRRFISDLENGKSTAEIGKILQVLGALGVALTASAQWTL
jgi:HTH-type transcriptional regulator/antitoxin HipB